MSAELNNDTFDASRDPEPREVVEYFDSKEDAGKAACAWYGVLTAERQSELAYFKGRIDPRVVGVAFQTASTKIVEAVRIDMDNVKPDDTTKRTKGIHFNAKKEDPVTKRWEWYAAVITPTTRWVPEHRQRVYDKIVDKLEAAKEKGKPPREVWFSWSTGTPGFWKRDDEDLDGGDVDLDEL